MLNCRDNIAGDCDNLGSNFVGLALDGAGFVLPIVGLGAVWRASQYAKKLDKAKIGCFVADTVVVCDPDDEKWEGTQPIETIKEGDYVLSKDERSGQISCEQVSSPTVIPDQEIFRVRMRNASGESSEIDATGKSSLLCQ